MSSNNRIDELKIQIFEYFVLSRNKEGMEKFSLENRYFTIYMELLSLSNDVTLSNNIVDEVKLEYENHRRKYDVIYRLLYDT